MNEHSLISLSVTHDNFMFALQWKMGIEQLTIYKEKYEITQHIAFADKVFGMLQSFQNISTFSIRICGQRTCSIFDISIYKMRNSKKTTLQCLTRQRS